MAQRERPTPAASKDANKQRYVRRAIESASEYNLFLNKQRQRVYMDMQTDTPNYPVGLGRQNITLTRTTKVGRFPVAVMPSQYQDWYIEYTPEELQFLPVDTVLKGPIMRIDQLPPVLTTPDVSDFESDSESCCSTSSEGCSSCCSCCAQTDQLLNNNDPTSQTTSTNSAATTNATTTVAATTTQNNNNSGTTTRKSHHAGSNNSRDQNSTNTNTAATVDTNHNNHHNHHHHHHHH